MQNSFLTKLIYWLDTHTMHPLAWWYVILRSIQYKVEDILWPRTQSENGITSTGLVCPVCGYTEFTEQGLCEKCGNVILG